ncbi:nuclear pore complex protein Nup153-like isoform X2 [Anser cygnoides]|uniref:nuclear pore complex protein Nup153-like isoform X2 n=1 Tax=Anser cygnoides TaxID=8845 RepID=UPI0034D1A9EB
MREKTLPAEQRAEPSESNVTSYKFSTAASNGLSSGVSSGGGRMRRERGIHYLSGAVQEQEVEEPVLPNIPLPISAASLPQFNSSFIGSSAVSASPSAVSTAAMSTATPAAATGMANPSEVEGMTDPSEVEGMTDPSEVEDLTDLSEEEVEDMIYTTATSGITCSTVPSGLTYPIMAAGMPYLLMRKDISRSTAATTSVANSTEAAGMADAAATAAGKIQPTSTVSSPEFAFSSPVVKSTEAEVLPTSSIGFTFSVPVVKSAELSGPSGTPVTPFLTLDTTTSTNINTQKEEVKDFAGGPFTTAHVLKEGSVLDVLKNPDFGLLKTRSSTSAQPTTSTVVYTRPAITTFSAGKETSKQASYWQSDTCDPFLQNKDIKDKCVTCQATKASTVESMKQTVSSSQCDTSKPAAPPAGMLGFGDKFKTVPGTWDCDTCLVQNKPEATKCIACETPKPGTGVMPALT